MLCGNHLNIPNHFKFFVCIGTSSEPEVTAQAVGARKRKLNEDFTGIQRNGSKCLQLLEVGVWYFCSSKSERKFKVNTSDYNPRKSNKFLF